MKNSISKFKFSKTNKIKGDANPTISILANGKAGDVNDGIIISI